MTYEIERRAGHAPFAAEDSYALKLFAAADAIQVAASSPAGEPVLRTFTPVVVDGALCFHGGDHGEKLGLVDRPVVASCERVVAQIASYFVHPELACPASTYYESAFARGVVRRVDDLGRKARILSALMERYQPEGGYLPIHSEAPHYRKVLSKLLVCELLPEQLSAKRKLGQHRTLAQIERLLEGLWRRGQPGDVKALRTIAEAHPDRPVPSFLRIPNTAYQLDVAPDEQDALAAAELLEGQYWTGGISREQIVRAHLGTQAWVVARDTEGRVIASGRAVSDGGRFAYLMDVIVHADVRGKGIGQALIRVLLDHPCLRGLHTVALRTRDAQRFYEAFGFQELVRHFPTSEMVRRSGAS